MIYARFIASILLLLLALSSVGRADSLSPEDQAFRKGWSLLSEERFAEAREAFGSLSAGEYDLGDYVLLFTGVALVKEGKAAEAAVTLDRLVISFPESPLAPYLAHELAFAAAKAGDLPAARGDNEGPRGEGAGGRGGDAEGRVGAGRGSRPPRPVSPLSPGQHP